MYWRIGAAYRKRARARNRADFRVLVKRGPPPGLIAFEGDLPVGWCQLTPRNISPPNYPSPIQIVEVELPAGAQVAYDSGARDVALHQQIWVQLGAIEVTPGRVTHRLGEDDCLAMQVIEPITFRNRTRKPASYIVVLAPGPRQS